MGVGIKSFALIFIPVDVTEACFRIANVKSDGDAPDFITVFATVSLIFITSLIFREAEDKTRGALNPLVVERVGVGVKFVIDGGVIEGGVTVGGVMTARGVIISIIALGITIDVVIHVSKMGCFTVALLFKEEVEKDEPPKLSLNNTNGTGGVH